MNLKGFPGNGLIFKLRYFEGKSAIMGNLEIMFRNYVSNIAEFL